MRLVRLNEPENKVRINKPEKANKSGCLIRELHKSCQAAGDGLLVLPILPKIKAAQSWGQ